jgi:hypothetical protein
MFNRRQLLAILLGIYFMPPPPSLSLISNSIPFQLRETNWYNIEQYFILKALNKQQLLANLLFIYFMPPYPSPLSKDPLV